MAVSVTVNGTSYNIPQTNERGWGSVVTSWIQSVSSNTLQKSGGSFTLTANIDFGATYGPTGAFFSTRSSNPAGTGVFRLSNNEVISWRNAANDGNLSLKVNSSNQLEYNGVVLSGSSALTASRAMVTDASGFASASSVTSTELGRLSGITSDAVGETDTQTLTNKTFDDDVTIKEISTPSTPASGYGSIYFKSDGKLYFLNDAGTETEVGAGSGGINYITNPSAESGTDGWSTYADAAAASPVDGTGGSPNVTWTRVTSSPLRGVGMFTLTKDAANRQGEGVSYDFTIASADKAKMLSISFEYQVSAAAVAGSDSVTGDINVYIYDVTNSTLIQPTPFKLPGGTGYTWKYAGVFQTSASSTSYRLILHVAGTNSSSATYDFDNFVVGPQPVVQGPPVTDWVSYTPTGNWVSNTTFTGVWRRVGESMQVRGRVTLSGAPTSAVFTFSLPSGYTINDTVMPGGAAGTNPLGIAVAYDDSGGSGYSRIEGTVVRSSTTAVTVAMLAGGTDEYTTQMDQANPFTFAASDVVAVEFTVPITGWGSNVVMSNDADTRVLSAQAVGQPSSTTSGNVIIYGTENFDTHGAYDHTTGRFTCPISGIYEVSHQSNSTNTHVVSVYKNAVSEVILGVVVSGVGGGTVQVKCVAGDILDIRPGATTGTYSSTGGYVSFKRISGPATIAASERIFARYKRGTAQTIAHSTTTILDYFTKDVDTHGSVTTGANWAFTAPRAGVCTVSASAGFDAGAGWAAGESVVLYLYKNGSAFSILDFSTQQTTHGEYITVGGSTIVPVVAGDTLNIRIVHTEGGSRTTHASDLIQYVSIDCV